MDNSSPKPGTSTRKPTPAEARRSAKNDRKRAGQEAARAAAAARKRRNAGLGAGIGVLAIVGVVVLIVALSGSPAKKTTASGSPSASTSAAPVPAAGPTADPSPSASCPAPAATPPSASTAKFPPVTKSEDPALKKEPVVKAGTGTVTKLTVKTLIKGTGPAVKTCDDVVVNYVGVTYADGKVFDASWKNKATFTVSQIGFAQVIPGWNQGLVGVKVGSRVQLDIPAALAYGDPAPSGYPSGTLRFVIDVLSATSPS